MQAGVALASALGMERLAEGIEDAGRSPRRNEEAESRCFLRNFTLNCHNRRSRRRP